MNSLPRKGKEIAGVRADVRVRFLQRRDAFVTRWWRSHGDFVALLERICGPAAGRGTEGSAHSGEERGRARGGRENGGAA
ncbi:MAG: hypothetical protein JXP48_12225 [Acidobacteria bacterium]|nr:hypothetical protein [Acidobacteriota bacterium]